MYRSSYKKSIRAVAAIVYWLIVLRYGNAQFSSPNLPRLVVLDFSVDSITPVEHYIVIDTLSYELAQSGRFIAMGRDERDRAIDDLEKADKERSSQELAAAIGTDLFVTGTLAGLESGIAVVASINYSDSRDSAIAQVSKVFRTIDGLIEDMAIAAELIDSYRKQATSRRGFAIEMALRPLSGISFGVVYQISRFFAVGAFAASESVTGVVYQPRLSRQNGSLDFSYSSVRRVTGYEELKLLGGLKLVFGNKVDSSAIAINLPIHREFIPQDMSSEALLAFSEGLNPFFVLVPRSIGFYYRNLMVSVFPAIAAFGETRPYFDIGYSLYLGR